MKKLITVLFLIIWIYGYSQVTPSGIIRVVNSTTAFNETVPAGKNIVDNNTGRQYLVLIPLADTKTIGTCTYSEIRDISLWPLKRRIFGRYIDGSADMDSVIRITYLDTMAVLQKTTAASMYQPKGSYEPAISKSTGYAKWTGSAWSWDNSTYVTGTPWTAVGYLTSETDPTIYAWAKAATKPSYSYPEVGAQVAGTYSTDIHSNITALNAVTNTNTGDNATNSQYSGLVTNANHSGDATGSGALTLATVNSDVGTYQGITVNAKGLVIAASNQGYLTALHTIGVLTGQVWGYDSHPSTLANYGITETPWSGMGYLTTTISHTHGNITYAGAIGSTTGLPIITTTSGVLTAGSFGTTSGTFAQGNDSRFHASGSDNQTLIIAGTTSPTIALSGSNTATFSSGTGSTLNQSGGTITVGTNATTSNTASTIVLRDASGNVSLVGDLCTTSDLRLKKFIRPIHSSFLSEAAKINFRSFSYKKDTTNQIRFGVIAQEVERYLPEVVRTDSAGTKSVYYIDMLVILVAQQKEAIERLEKRVSELGKRVNNGLPEYQIGLDGRKIKGL